MASKRPFKFTTQEFATVFWCMGIFIIMISLFVSYDPAYHIFIIQESMLLFIGVGLFFTALGYMYPCYQISKWDCNIFIDKMEPGWDGWLRFTKKRKFAPQIIKSGPLGQEKGLVSGHKADIINRGDFPVTLLNGNHAVIKYDLMSHNVNLNEAVGWELTTHKYGLLGSAAYRRCMSDDKIQKKEKKGLFKKEK